MPTGSTYVYVGKGVDRGRWEGLKTKALPEKGTPFGQLASDVIKSHG